MLKEKINNLLNAVKDDLDAAEFIDSSLNRFRDYVNSVVTMEYRMGIATAVKEGEELREIIQTLDRSRHIAHESAISACSQLNRLSERVGLPPFFDGDINDRYQVADFCKDFVDEMWFNGRYREKGKDLFESLINKHESINSKSFIEAENVL